MIGIAKTIGRLIAVLVDAGIIEREQAVWILEPLKDKAESEETNMSKDEAIKILAAIRSDAIQGTCYVTESSAEALEMAIEALKR